MSDIALILGKKKPAASMSDMSDSSDDEESPDSEKSDDAPVSKEERSAMKLFEGAESTDEKVHAFRMLMKACESCADDEEE